MIQMGTILDVADNSGAKQDLLHPAAGRLHRPLRAAWATSSPPT